MSQLSLFGDEQKQLKLTPHESVQREKVLVEVISHCKYCKQETRLAPHEMIHTMDWMRANWREIDQNKFFTSGYCSRECEQLANKKRVIQQ